MFACCVVALVGSGCPGEAIDEERAITLTIRVPPETEAVIVGERDAEALGLEQRRLTLDEGPSSLVARVTTSLRADSDRSDEHCFIEPVLALEDGGERLLIEPGECFGHNSVMDRVDIEILQPRNGEEVGSVVEVEIDNEVPAGDLTLHALVNGNEVTTVRGESPSIAVDLTGVAPGPITLRVEARSPDGWVHAADVVELTVVPDTP